ncbi:major facilitator family transporter [Pseudomonas sp. M47T1]|uniref:MFS transporter n=1 Tax=Pseudomonas sp. M47T1 TaxID=1179778 RepID=UPI0002607B2E|nr:MFS transporter [Pseudomonas sp. M47T1]EIK96219.1 major facilitator family transporter [Pseudomonas sp. M47T1]
MTRARSPSPPLQPLPLLSLLALALAGFITILTEALPAGLLPQMALGMHVPQAWVGQTVSVYALGSLLAAIPLTAATQGLRRRPLLLTAIAGFAIANSVTALSASYWLMLCARLLAGVSAGLLWALLAGYAARMVPHQQKGRAIAIAMVGTPLALSLGVPAGTWLGGVLGWRLCFGLISVLTLLLMLWVRLGVPDFAGHAATQRTSLRSVLQVPGVRPVLWVVLGFVLAHNILYTYIAPYLAAAQMAQRTDLVLLVFGVSSLLGIWVTGVLIDRHLRRLTLASTLLFGLAMLVAATAIHQPLLVYVAIACWGLAFGGAATLFQTALAHAAGDAMDVAQAMLVTAWNTAIAGGGVVGGLLLQQFGPEALAPAMVGLLVVTLGVAWSARHAGFPEANAVTQG